MDCWDETCAECQKAIVGCDVYYYEESTVCKQCRDELFTVNDREICARCWGYIEDWSEKNEYAGMTVCIDCIEDELGADKNLCEQIKIQ